MSKHTPVSWVIEYDNDDCGRWYRVGPAKVWFSYNEDRQGEQEALANANLIAAAPDLLEALEALLADEAEEYIPSRLWANARRAIIKARGE